MPEVPKSPITDQEVLLIETVLKVASIERLLIKANVFTEVELTDTMKQLSSEVMSLMKSTKGNIQ